MRLFTKQYLIALLTFCLLTAGLYTADAQRPVAGSGTLPVHLTGCAIGGRTSAALPLNAILLRTGNAALDNSMLDDLTELDKVYQVNAPVYFLNDNTLNAFATNSVYPALIRADGGDPNANYDGSVFFGVRLLQEEFRQGEGKGYSIPTILAHEFAHVLQSRNRFPYQGKWRELHADYMAGWFTAHRSRFRVQDSAQSLTSLFNKGDYGFFSPDHHGTPRERADAFLAGYQLNLQGSISSGQLAYTYGKQYVEQRGAR